MKPKKKVWYEWRILNLQDNRLEVVVCKRGEDAKKTVEFWHKIEKVVDRSLTKYKIIKVKVEEV